MKQFTNKETNVVSLDKDKKQVHQKYSDILKMVINSPMGSGITIDEMAARLKIRGVLDSAAETIALEDSDYTTLVGLLKTFKWGAVHEDIVALMDDVKNAESI